MRLDHVIVCAVGTMSYSCNASKASEYMVSHTYLLQISYFFHETQLVLGVSILPCGCDVQRGAVGLVRSVKICGLRYEEVTCICGVACFKKELTWVGDRVLSKVEVWQRSSRKAINIFLSAKMSGQIFHPLF